MRNATLHDRYPLLPRERRRFKVDLDANHLLISDETEPHERG